jgi:TetR/AcrR family transcriptional regulator, cholesterol catabolism regulator
MVTKFALRTFSNDEALVKERRMHIVRCSSKVFVKKGYDVANIRDIALACQMSSGSLYHYFGSKEEILYSIIDDATMSQVDYLEKYATDLSELNPVEALREIIKEFFNWHDRNQNTTVFVYQETKNLPQSARDQIFESESRIHDIFENILKRGSKSGDFNVVDPSLTAHNIVVLGHAWALRRWYLRKNWTFEAYLEEQTDAIMKLILKDQ